MSENEFNLPSYLIAAAVAAAFSEDLQLSANDWTANLIDANQNSSAIIKTNQDMVVCGSQWVNQAFKLADSSCQIDWYVSEGEFINAGGKLCQIKGKARGLLSAERTALNFLQSLAATATITRQYCALAQGTTAKIMDTRKTIPGLRLAQKYAVRVGGGTNQRVGLFDGVLIKENHIIAHGGIKQVLKHAFMLTPKHIPIQIEVENFAELVEAAENNARLILLDNMTLEEIRHCVAYAGGLNKTVSGTPLALEVSGNVNLTTVRDYALTGVDRISIGGLTKNIQAIDLSMRFI